jgi:redox-sensitive bicupin YhaK (pirin superfamily)
MVVRVVAGDISAKDATNRVAIPTAAQPRWPPFERVSETIATPQRRLPPHRHERVEVLTYVTEGSGSYDYASEPTSPLGVGSTRLLTAFAPTAHAINPLKGGTLRYFAVVATLPEGASGSSRVQSVESPESGVLPDGTSVVRIAGVGTSVASTVGIDCEAIRFHSAGTSFRRVGHDHLALCYALAGRGTVDNAPVEGGEAALISDAAGFALQGSAGFRAVFVRVPRSAPTAGSAEPAIR